MLSRLTSYIYGETASEPTPEQTSVSLRAVEQEDNDWILVERGSNNGSLNGDDRPTLTDSDDDLDICGESRSPSPALSRRSRRSSRCSQFSSRSRCSSASSCSMSSYRGIMEESWFVTPPPCFTTVEIPSIIKASSLENLLIEHPSLSVLEARFEANYKILMQAIKAEDDEFRNRKYGIPMKMTSEPVYVESDQDFVEEEYDHGVQFYSFNERARTGPVRRPLPQTSRRTLPQTPRRTHRRTPRRTPVMHERHEMQENHEMNADASEQKQEAFIAAGKIHKILNKKTRRQSYNRGPMERNNKAREANGRNCKRRRSDHSQAQRNSRANNNRKC